jgi:KUP system potassium uptake protein
LARESLACALRRVSSQSIILIPSRSHIVTFIWLLLLGGTGVYNITTHPGIMRAFDPSRAVMWFVRTGQYDYLAGVLLAITGCEAMFANLGQFNKAAIRIGFGCIAYPMLILAYLVSRLDVV